MPSKQDVSIHLKNFLALVERQFHQQVQTIRSDNGSEFICLSEIFNQKGIHETSCVGTPQQNRHVGRKHQHILNVARALRFQTNLHIEFWSYCIPTTRYLINRTPTKILQGKTPFELIYNHLPPIEHLRVFGCICYVHNQKHGGDKFATPSNRSIFLGYSFSKKGWRVYSLETGTVSVYREVVCCETEFPMRHQHPLHCKQRDDDFLDKTLSATVTNDKFIPHVAESEPVLCQIMKRNLCWFPYQNLCLHQLLCLYHLQNLKHQRHHLLLNMFLHLFQNQFQLISQ